MLVTSVGAQHPHLQLNHSQTAVLWARVIIDMLHFYTASWTVPSTAVTCCVVLLETLAGTVLGGVKPIFAS